MRSRGGDTNKRRRDFDWPSLEGIAFRVVCYTRRACRVKCTRSQQTEKRKFVQIVDLGERLFPRVEMM